MKMKASFDLNTLDGKKKLFNAKKGASVSIKDLEDGTVLDVVDALIYEEVIETYGKPQDGQITVLFTEDGNSFASVSDVIANATDDLIDFLGDVEVDVLQVQIKKQVSKGGNEFLNIQVL